jgi:hypothetical protein
MKPVPQTLLKRLQDLAPPHMARTSFTSVGNCPDSREPLLRPSPAIDHDAEKLGVYKTWISVMMLSMFQISSPNRG